MSAVAPHDYPDQDPDDTGPLPRVPGEPASPSSAVPPPVSPASPPRARPDGPRRPRRAEPARPADRTGEPGRPAERSGTPGRPGEPGRRPERSGEPRRPRAAAPRPAQPGAPRSAQPGSADARGSHSGELRLPRRAGDTPPPGTRRRPPARPPQSEKDTPQPAAAKETPPATGHGHGHGHGHGPAAPASQRVRKLLIWLLAPLALATVVGMIVLYPWGSSLPKSAVPQGTPVQAAITTATSGPCLQPGQVQVGSQPDPNAKPCLTVDLQMSDGPAAGKPVRLTVPIEPSTPRFTAGDKVVLAYNGGNPLDPQSFTLVDFQRGTPLVLLAALFAIAVLVLGRWQGVAALVALVLSFVVIVLFVLPAILAGENPLVVAIAGAGAIMFLALYLTHGLSARTSVAVLGTLVSLALIGILSAIFSAAASLTGLDDSTTTLIASLGHGIDARGLLLAGIVIGALGVLDDVTITQTSAVWELRRANPSLSWRELYSSGLRIGRDHVGSAVNTLVMAYAGAALPVMLYSAISGVGLGSLLGSEDIAAEIIRTLAGSVGIVAAVPVTTVLAALIAAREPVEHLISTSKPAESH
ncbi:YibE/F family protein [Amycolatopsis echigonensis]|uniref:YibE/F family protein n=1 Tax=Amycolatopsis echigonensis TaxID=2576905 RepID=A0A8E1W6I1_9PSEU|nr:YibE/F family protein [Amycolatopsis echigonensis]MBB2504771.1 YibE/F family protein [Amycolatopsis echigonensis]